MVIDYKKIEEKWQKAWAESTFFESEPSEKKEIMVTAAMPYVNSPPHIGHFRTYGTADVYARYMRMRGYNVLFPVAFHKTGTPILGIAKRIIANDQDLINDFISVYKVDKSVIPKMVDPYFIAEYFKKEFERELKACGFSIDWRRTFDSIDPLFSKMVEWQFYKLKDLGFLTQGAHPVGWCTNENNAVGQHDTKGDMQPEIEKIVGIKFKEKDTNNFFICATFRPETIDGVTNLFVNPDVEYSLVELDGFRAYVSRDMVAPLSYQMGIKIIEEVKGSDLLNKVAINPSTNENIPVLPGRFVKPDFGTGVVMSVPAHAPFDYSTLKVIENSGIDVPKGPYKSVIRMGNSNKSDDEPPAFAYLKKHNWSIDNNSSEIVEIATKELYKDEAHSGVMISGKYANMKESEARNLIRNDLIESKNALLIYVLANDSVVKCRCGATVIVKVVEDQWFINYGDKKWKDNVIAHLSTMKLYPEKTRITYQRIIDWIEERATERAEGLGTKFPFNKEHIIESLSDSTIYTAFYTIINILRSANISPESLKPEFFDYVFNGSVEIEFVSKTTGISAYVLKHARESYEYWYKNTSRHSGTDLLYNHLIMYIFNNVGIFKKEYWPKQIVANALLMYNGQKMSKSLRNTVSLHNVRETYGTDALRAVIIGSVNIDSDSNFTDLFVNQMLQKFEQFGNIISELNGYESKELKPIDFWLYSRLNSKITEATQNMEEFRFGDAFNGLFYGSLSEIKHYVDRNGSNKLVLTDFISGVVKMLSPILPHVCEEFWSMLGNNNMLIKENWPEPDNSMASKEVESEEKIIEDTISDVRNAIALTSKMEQNQKKKLSKISLIIADQWKFDAYNALVSKRKLSEVLSLIDQKDKERTAKYLSQFKNPMELIALKDISSELLYNYFKDACKYIKKEVDCDNINIERESESQNSRASRALPNKPSISLEWN